MSRLFSLAVLALIVAGSASGIRADGQVSITPFMDEFNPAAGPLTVAIESVSPTLSRVRFIRGGTETGVFESSGFTITTDKNGLTISSADKVTATRGALTLSVDRFQAVISPGGTSWQGEFQTTK